MNDSSDLRRLRSASLDPNGYVREDAVRQLARVTTGEELPFLLLRLNDWVWQIRDAARAAVLARITPEYAPHFVQHLATLVRVREGRRANHASVIDAVVNLLVTTPAVRSDLINAMGVRLREVRRFAFTILLRGEVTPDVLRAAVESEDPSLRLRATLRSLIGAPVEVLVPRLLDGRAAIRDLARFELRRQVPDFDFVALYREKRFIPGIEETGSAADAGFLVPYLTAPRARTRAAAVRAILRLGGDAYVASVLPLLGDTSLSVSRQTTLSLRKHASSLDAAQLWTFVEQPAHAHVRPYALALIAALPKWESLPYLLRARANEHLRRWGRSYLVPTATQLAAAQAAFAEAEKELDRGVAAVIRLELSSN